MLMSSRNTLVISKSTMTKGILALQIPLLHSLMLCIRKCSRQINFYLTLSNFLSKVEPQTCTKKRIFQVLNAQYSFDGLYLSCVSENIDSLRPFGDVPRKLASSVKRSLLAARALVKAMRTGHEIAKQMAKVCFVLVELVYRISSIKSVLPHFLNGVPRL